MSRRVRTSLLSSAGILLVLLAVPWAPWTVSVDATLMPWTRARLEAPEDGTIASVRAREGDTVRAGEVVAALESPSVASGMAGAAAQGEGLRKQASRSREKADQAAKC